jgi:hypothetical protein
VTVSVGVDEVDAGGGVDLGFSTSAAVADWMALEAPIADTFMGSPFPVSYRLRLEGNEVLEDEVVVMGLRLNPARMEVPLPCFCAKSLEQRL